MPPQKKGKSPGPAVALSDSGKALEAKYASMQAAIKAEEAAAQDGMNAIQRWR